MFSMKVQIISYLSPLSPYYVPLMLLLSRFSHIRLCNPTDGSPPGSSVPGILQARTLEWAAISFSTILCATPYK